MTDSGQQPAPSSGAASAGRPRSNWTAGRAIGMVLAGLGGLIGLALVVAGLAVLAAYAFGRDDDGYLNSDRKQLSSSTHAITTEEIDLGVEEAGWAPEELLGDIRIRVEGAAPVFVGIGPNDDVEGYLGGVDREELLGFDGDRAELDPRAGGAPRSPPGEQAFWVGESEGSGEQELIWDAESGRWTVVVMNADASRGIEVEAVAGIKVDWAVWVGVGVLVIGLLMAAGAIAVVFLISRRASRP